MRIIVVGAGEVGSSIAGSLAGSHDVTVVDIDADIVESLSYNLDVLPVAGDATDLETLEAAGFREADLVIASTDDDEVNLAICGTVSSISDAFTIARVKRPTYLNTWRQSKGAFGVDYMVCTDLLAAQAIVRILGLPTARDVDSFAGGMVQMGEFEVPRGSPVADQTVEQADRFELLTFAAVIRDDSIEIAGGATRIRAGDRVVVIGSPESLEEFAASVYPGAITDVDEVVIAGGSTIGQLIAEFLSDRGLTPRLIEADPDRARRLAEDLPQTTVLQQDATDMDFLDREHVGDADVLVSALDSDERSLLVSLLAKRLGDPRTVAVVDQAVYVDLFEAVGIDVAVNPRKVAAEEITRHTRGDRAENVAIIESDRAEVLEIEIDADSVLADRTIQESMEDLPDGLVIGSITRGNELITPRGNTVVEVGDHIIVFVRSTDIENVTTAL